MCVGDANVCICNAYKVEEAETLRNLLNFLLLSLSFSLYSRHRSISCSRVISCSTTFSFFFSPLEAEEGEACKFTAVSEPVWRLEAVALPGVRKEDAVLEELEKVLVPFIKSGRERDREIESMYREMWSDVI